MERCQILVLTICGQIGKKGSGITGFPALTPAGASASVIAHGDMPPLLGVIAAAMEAVPTFVEGKFKGHTNEKILYNTSVLESS